MSGDASELVRTLRPELRPPQGGVVWDDTSRFMDIGPGDVIRLEGRHYLVHRDAVERSFNYEDTKYWVKKCMDLESGRSWLLKLVFHESFDLAVGSVRVHCFRSPIKEARILDLVRGDNRFMQGFTAHDTRGNPVRVIERIDGGRWDMRLPGRDLSHEGYFRQFFPDVLDTFLAACDAIGFLHAHFERHGDICRDHLWLERGTGAVRWIDFDYAYETPENPFGLDVFGLGEMLLFLAGRWEYSPQVLAQLGLHQASIEPGDWSLIHHNQLVNLKKIFPYIPEELNRVFLHFSAGARVGYETVDELADDLRACRPLLPQTNN